MKRRRRATPHRRAGRRSSAANDTFYLFDYKKMTVAQAVGPAQDPAQAGRLASRSSRTAWPCGPWAEFPADLRPAFRKPTAMAYTAADPIVLAKALKDFSVQNKVLVVKGGVVEGQYFAAGAIRRDRQALLAEANCWARSAS